MRFTRRRSPAWFTALVLATGLSTALGQIPASGSGGAASAPAPDDLVTFGDPPLGVSDIDVRGRAAPTSAQRTAIAALDADVRWNDFGTPASLLPRDGSLGSTAHGPAPAAARAWLGTHHDAFGLSEAEVADLELVNNQRLRDSDARAVLFRQRFGDLTPALDSMVTVTVAGGEIVYVSSSLTRTTGEPASPTMTPVQAWLKAARNVGRSVDTDGISTSTRRGWTRLHVPGLAQEQQVRLRALAMADGTVRPVFEANVVDVAGGAATAYTLMVDAVTGTILHRENKVEHSTDLTTFQGAFTGTACGPRHPFELTDDKTRSIVVTAAPVNTVNDAVIKLWGPDGKLLASGDTGTSPEALAHTSDDLPAGVYHAEVCPYTRDSFVGPGDYVGSVATSDQAAQTPPQPMPKWRFFPANPELDHSPDHSPENDVVGCWGEECELSSGPLEQPFSSPWDYSHDTGTPTLTTTGNNAVTHEAWVSPLTPGGLLQAPVSATRDYTTEFTDAWNNNRCDPANLVPGGNDIDASVTNLFVSHNRMHDYSYGLGFTEANYNMQQDNLGRNPDPTRANDPEIGNAQAGALSGGTPTYLGRDNANQITLQDGIPGITNQYLFQPIAGAFYSPCADGALDMSIAGHEYTHAISNRMVAGPDQGLTSEQGGAMGESWSDLVAAEYIFSHGYSTGASPWAIGAYATGNKQVGIRNYAVDDNPLHYGDYGFDSTGDEVHADGEIWNGTMWEVRQALVEKWDGEFPYDDEALQLRCAQGTATESPLPADRCPGNRRWVQLMFDSFLLQQGGTSMLDARDALLAADQARFDGANQQVLWQAFAQRGMGASARTPDADSGDVVAGFDSPLADNSTVTFVSDVAGKVFVGDYEARVTPVADTNPATGLDRKASFAPGTYDLLFQAPGHGFSRTTLTVRAGKPGRVSLDAPVNLASRSSGASILDSSAGSLNVGSLIDDTESTNWAGVTSGTNVDETPPHVSIDLAGGVRTVRRVQVSAMLRPALDDPSDPDSGSRFTALRRFALEACVASCDSPSATWTRFYTSPADAFPGVRPRPVAPNLTLRSFDVPDTRAAAIRFVALENQCTGHAGYAGEQDDDPLNATDCKTASDRGQSVRAAELQVYE